MAPIIVTTNADEVADPLVDDPSLVKEKLRANRAPGALVADDRDVDDDDAATVDLEESSEDEAPEAEEADGDSRDRRESKLFAEESQANGSPPNSPGGRALSLNEGGALCPPSTPSSAFTPGLSLMASSSPTSSFSSSGGEILGGAGLGVPPLYDETKWIQSQIDADEVLARQLQEEEEERKRNFTPKARAKPNVVPSRLDSWFGEPSRFEVKGNYSRVGRAEPGSAPSPRSCSGSPGDFGGLSGGVSALASSFRRWGSNVTAAATDFFGEDIQMQVKKSRPGGASGRYQNEV